MTTRSADAGVGRYSDVPYVPADGDPIERVRYLLACIETNAAYPEKPFSQDETCLRGRCAVVVAQAREARATLPFVGGAALREQGEGP